MHRYVIGCQLHDFFHGIADICGILSRQTQNQIHIDILMSFLSCLAEHPTDILHRMLSADRTQGFGVHRLRIDGNAVHAVLL